MTSPLAILDANQFFISVIENYSPIFTSFVFPDQYLKPKGYSEKWPTIFFRNSIPSSVPQHYIAYGNKRVKRPMPYFLFTFHCEWCRRSLRGLPRRSTGGLARRARAARGLRCLGPFGGELALQEAVSCAPLWNPAPEHGAPLSQDAGPRGLLMDGALALPGGELCRRHQGLALGGTRCPVQFGLVGVCPSQGNSVLFHPCYC